jgi:hypothetical protein
MAIIRASGVRTFLKDIELTFTFYEATKVAATQPKPVSTG